MIDLESMAETRAKELAQSEREWVQALRQPSFNDFTTYLSDGEVENFVLCFESPESLTVVSGFFMKAYMNGHDSAYADFLDIVTPSHLDLREGFDFIFQLAAIERLQKNSWSYDEKLDSLKSFIAEKKPYLMGQDISEWSP
jgi:hypothetical protein